MPTFLSLKYLILFIFYLILAGYEGLFDFSFSLSSSELAIVFFSSTFSPANLNLLAYHRPAYGWAGEVVVG